MEIPIRKKLYYTGATKTVDETWTGSISIDHGEGKRLVANLYGLTKGEVDGYAAVFINMNAK